MADPSTQTIQYVITAPMMLGGVVVGFFASLLVGFIVMGASSGMGRAWKGLRDFLTALVSVLMALALWLLVFQSAYRIAHGTPAAHPIEYVPLDYLLLVASLAVAVWLVFQFVSPPEDISQAEHARTR